MNRVISIIIPTWNEEKGIDSLLQHLTRNISEKNQVEINIVDCNSNDETQNVVTNFINTHNDWNIRLLISEKGRAKQMNYGAANAKGGILYFLHADSFPPKHFDKLIRNEIEHQHLAGCFQMKFDSNHWWLKLAGWLTQFKSKACRGGDQSLFISKKLFDELGGYNSDFTIFEDQEFIFKLYERNEFSIIKHWLTTSSRRYQSNGIWKLQYHFWAIYVKKFFGASANDLHQYYLKYIKD